MKLYGNATGANCRRVAVYLVEKGLTLDTENMDLSSGVLKTPAFLAMNPAGMVPVLELDDGSYLPESSAILEYLEELHPTPAMIGDTPAQRGRVRAIERVASDLGVLTIATYMHSHPMFAARLTQVPAVAEASQVMVDQHLKVLEAYIGDNAFLAGDSPTTADCTLFPLFQTCRVRLKAPFGMDQPKLSAWYERFEKRPSAAY
jgi:glutathione S-transferase